MSTSPESPPEQLPEHVKILLSDAVSVRAEMLDEWWARLRNMAWLTPAHPLSSIEIGHFQRAGPSRVLAKNEKKDKLLCQYLIFLVIIEI